MLSYVLYSLQSGTELNIHKSIIRHFTAIQICDAKDISWEKCEPILGKQPRRVGSSSHPEHDAHLQDIFAAIEKLDKVQKLPTVVINAMHQNLFPHSHPEELNDITPPDRLNHMEKKLSD